MMVVMVHTVVGEFVEQMLDADVDSFRVCFVDAHWPRKIIHFLCAIKNDE